MRVTGDCFRADRFALDLRAVLDRALTFFDALFPFAPRRDFAVPLLRAVAFDAGEVLPRTFLPDDFDAVAMIDSSGKVQNDLAQDSRTRMRCWSPRGSQNQRLVAECNLAYRAVPGGFRRVRT